MRAWRAILAACFLVPGTGAATEPVEVLSAEMVARLEPAKEKPLGLAADGDVARFLSGDGQWQELAPPLILDLDRDGIKDFVVVSVVDPTAMRRALFIFDWGDAPGSLGKAVFYLVLDGEGEVVEWAGTHALAPRRGPAAPGP